MMLCNEMISYINTELNLIIIAHNISKYATKCSINMKKKEKTHTYMINTTIY